MHVSLLYILYNSAFRIDSLKQNLRTILSEDTYENLCGNCVGGRVDICMTFHKRAFDFLYPIGRFLPTYGLVFRA
jgi:hypothetical protein